MVEFGLSDTQAGRLDHLDKVLTYEPSTWLDDARGHRSREYWNGHDAYSGPTTRHAVSADETYLARGFPEVRGAFRVGVGYERSPDDNPNYPYRWGLPDALEPGKKATITGYVKMDGSQRPTYWAGLVEELKRWHVDEAANPISM